MTWVLTVQHGQGVGQQGSQEVEVLLDALGTPGGVDYKRPPANSGQTPADCGKWRKPGGLATEHLRQTGRVALNHHGRGLGGHVPRGKAGSAAG